MSIQALRERKTEIARASNELLAANGDKIWSKEDRTKFDDMMDQLERVNAQISAYQAQLDAAADELVNDAERSGARKPTNSESEKVRGALSIYLSRAADRMSAEDISTIQNAMSTTTPSEGGYTVAPLVAPEIIEAQKDFGGIREVATVITMESGNNLNYPTSDGTTEMGEWVGENQAAGDQDIAFGTVPLNVYMSSSKKIALPWQLIADSGIDTVAFVLNRLMTRLLRLHNYSFTVGDGVDKPFGIVGRATAGKLGAAGQVASVTYDDVIDLIHSVNTAYRKRGVFSMADSSVRVLRKLKDNNGRPIFTPGYEHGITQDVPDLLAGKRIVVNDDMPAMAASAKSILFGDHKQYVVRDIAGLIVRRFDDSAFALKGQVGFCGWQRTGGNLLDTKAVKYYQNAAA